MPDPCQKALLSVILHRFLLFVILHERAKLQYADAFDRDLSTGNELRASCASTGISQVANRCVAIRCTFLEVPTMSGYRFRVVLCDYERYIMSLYMYYRVVVDTLKPQF